MTTYSKDMSGAFSFGTDLLKTSFSSFNSGFSGALDAGISALSSLFGSTGSGFDVAGGGGFSSLFGAGLGALFDKGGIMTAHGALKLRKYREGGVATGPQAAIFGEGDKPEAFVPLPDGRRIPVKVEGQGDRKMVNLNLNMTVITPDPGQFGRNKEQIARKAGIAFQRALARDN